MGKYNIFVLNKLRVWKPGQHTPIKFGYIKLPVQACKNFKVEHCNHDYSYIEAAYM